MSDLILHLEEQLKSLESPKDNHLRSPTSTAAINMDLLPNDIKTGTIEHNFETLQVNKTRKIKTHLDPVYTNEYKDIAKHMWNLSYEGEDYFKYTAILGSPTAQDRALCEQFIALFQPWEISLLKSLRRLCSRLYLVGETTHIDQILEVFSISWVESNPKNTLGDYKTIHIISFALLILNSDLHSHVQESQVGSFTRDEFVGNVWMALSEDDTNKHSSLAVLEPTLRSLYESIRSQPLELLRVRQAPIFSTQTMSVLKLRSLSSSSSIMKRSMSKKDSLSNISVLSNKRMSSFGSQSNVSDLSDMTSDVEYLKDKHDGTLESLGPPWLIQGILKTEPQTLPTTSSNSRVKGNWLAKFTRTSVISSELDIYNIKNWRDCIVTIQKGSLRQCFFSSSSNRSSFFKSKSNRFVDGKLVKYNLNSAMAMLVESTSQHLSNSTRKTDGVAWMLTIPNLLSNEYDNDKKVVYYAPTLEIANNFIETCNFWAARITPIPSTDDRIVTNVEYGWSEQILTMNKGIQDVKLSKWKCLLSIESSFIPSNCTIEEQFLKLKDYVANIKGDLEKHCELKLVLERVWGKDKSLNEKFLFVMENWSEKYAHLFQQHAKFKQYLESLALALAFKASKI